MEFNISVYLRPLKAFNASSRSSRVGMSKWLVGSSNTSRATGFNKNCANATRAYELLQNKGHQGTMIFVASKISCQTKEDERRTYHLESGTCSAGPFLQFSTLHSSWHLSHSLLATAEAWNWLFLCDSVQAQTVQDSINTTSPVDVTRWTSGCKSANRLGTPAATLTTLRRVWSHIT